MENNKTNRLGETNYNQHGTLMKIIKYNSYNDIDVEFQDEYKYVAKNMSNMPYWILGMWVL